MPSQTDPFSRDPNRQPGTPQVNNRVTPVPSQPQYPAPPGLAAGAPGRPPAPPSPAGVSGPFPQPPASSPAPQRGSSFPAPPQQPTARVQGGQQAGSQIQQRPQGMQSLLAPQPAPMPVRTPGPGETEQLPVGAQVQTPVGTFTRDTTGSGSVALSPEGQQKYKESVVKLRKQMGPTPKAMSLPGAPEMPAEPGKHNFNPWTGQFTRG